MRKLLFSLIVISLSINKFYPFQTHTSARNYTYVRMGLHIRMCRAIHTYAWSYAYVRVAQRIGKKISMKLFGGIIG